MRCYVRTQRLRVGIVMKEDKEVDLDYLEEVARKLYETTCRTMCELGLDPDSARRAVEGAILDHFESHKEADESRLLERACEIHLEEVDSGDREIPVEMPEPYRTVLKSWNVSKTLEAVRCRVKVRTKRAFRMVKTALRLK